jgi:hypothetical protein
MNQLVIRNFMRTLDINENMVSYIRNKNDVMNVP